MPNKFRFALSLIFVAALFTSCEKSNGTIGSGKFVDERPELGEKLTFPVVSYSRSWDSVSTKNPSQVILGNYDDPIFGRTNASFYTRILLSKSSPDFGEGTICDSVKVRIAYSSYYGVEGDDIDLKVYPLLEEQVDSLSYYSNGTVNYGSAIADTMIVLGPRDTVFNGVDTLVGFLSFDADPAYFQTNIFDAAINGESHFADNEDFVKEVPGLYFTDEGAGSSVAGYFNLDASGSLIQLYYHTGVDDTIAKVFNLTFGQNFGDPSLSYNLFSNDYTNAQFDLDMMDTVNGEVLTYVQGGSGVRTELHFPDLDTLIGKGYSINRAELSFDVLQGTAGPYRFPGSLILIQDLDTAQQLIKDYSSSVNPTGGTVARTDVREFNYTFNVTRMVHELVNDRKEILPILIAPSSSSANLHRVVLGGGMHPVIPAEFNIYYTRSE
jgi:hypothetical protein